MTNYNMLFFSILLSTFVSSCTLFDSNLNFLAEDISLVSHQFNEEAYLLAFPDVANTIKNPNNIYGLKSGYEHFKIVGNRERRINYQVYVQAEQDIADGFNEEAYLLAFPDVANTIKNPNNIYGLKSGYEHYMSAGKNEGRLTRTEYIKVKQIINSFKIKNATAF